MPHPSSHLGKRCILSFTAAGSEVVTAAVGAGEDLAFSLELGVSLRAFDTGIELDINRRKPGRCVAIEILLYRPVTTRRAKRYNDDRRGSLASS